MKAKRRNKCGLSPFLFPRNASAGTRSKLPPFARVVLFLCFPWWHAFFLFPFESNASTGINGGHNVLGSQDLSRRWYFAEGTTRAGFEEYICLLNPGNKPARTKLLYMLETGDNIEKTYDLAPARRFTVPVYHDVPAGHDVSCVIGSTEPVVAERPIYFDYSANCNGSHSAAGAKSPKTIWYFAEGCTRGGFDTYLCIMNPGEKYALAEIEYYMGNGTTGKKSAIPVKAQSRMTIAVHESEHGAGRRAGEEGDVSMRVRSKSDAGLIVERSMYFSYQPF